MNAEIHVRTADGRSKTVPLDKDRLAVGRAPGNDLFFAGDAGLSRHHLALERDGAAWNLVDLGSKNGTFLNGARLTHPARLNPGDLIHAGHLTIRFGPASRRAGETVIFTPGQDDECTSVAMATDLERALKTGGFAGERRVEALIRAGRELSRNRPLAELFHLILDLAIDAVGAARGVLMTFEDARLEARAWKGEGFRLSSAVRDRVMAERAALLVKDTHLDAALRNRQSIVAQDVRSMMAVPLETGQEAIGLIYVDSSSLVRDFTADDLNLLAVMANIAAVRIEHARLEEIEANERALERDLQQAAEIQRQTLPAAPPVVPGVELAGYNAPCRTVGGDYYGYHTYPDGRVAVMVGDVAGKGMPAALLVSSLQARLEVLLEDGRAPGDLLTRLNRLCASNCPAGRFITFFFAVLDPGGGLRFANAGHNPPLLVRAGGEVQRLEGGGLIMGIHSAAQYEEYGAALAPGDILVLYSDGVTEATRPAGNEEEFGEERLAALVARMRQAPLPAILDAITAALAEWTEGGPAADDMTLLLARRR